MGSGRIGTPMVSRSARDAGVTFDHPMQTEADRLSAQLASASGDKQETFRYDRREYSVTIDGKGQKSIAMSANQFCTSLQSSSYFFDALKNMNISRVSISAGMDNEFEFIIDDKEHELDSHDPKKIRTTKIYKEGIAHSIGTHQQITLYTVRNYLEGGIKKKLIRDFGYLRRLLTQENQQVIDRNHGDAVQRYRSGRPKDALTFSQSFRTVSSLGKAVEDRNPQGVTIYEDDKSRARVICLLLHPDCVANEIKKEFQRIAVSYTDFLIQFVSIKKGAVICNNGQDVAVALKPDYHLPTRENV